MDRGFFSTSSVLSLMELEDRHHFLSNLLDIESQYKECKFDLKKEAQPFIDSEISDKLRAFFRWNNASKPIVKNDSKIKEYMSKLGYFIIITDDRNIDKHTVLSYYQDKDKVEKIFDTVKNKTDGDRLRSHSQYCMDGRLFIKFIALII
jgi:transposase